LCPVDTRAAWSDVIQRRCGLALRDGQAPVLASMLRARMRALDLTDTAAYFDRLEAEPDGGAEWTELMECLVSHETTFFRTRSFDAIRSHVVPELRSRA
jgi:chemotaxis methyl-accepting protein methylase